MIVQSFLLLTAWLSLVSGAQHRHHHRRSDISRRRLQFVDPLHATSPAKRAPISLPSGWTYQACMADPSSSRLLSNKILDGATVSVNTCVAECNTRGFKYAGLEFAKECWCGNALNAPSLRAESSCSTPCQGDNTQICGGGNLISLYAKNTDISSYSYLGCYTDVSSPRTLPDYKVSSTSMTHNFCKTTCVLNGYPFAGIEAGNECWCASALTRGSKVADTDCKTPCTGDSTKTCGGGWRLTVFGPSAPSSTSSTATTSSSSTTTSAPASSTSTTAATSTTTSAGSTATDFTPMGCYADASTRLLPDYVYKSNTLTIPMCQAECKSKGYKYAGAENGNECYCSNTFPSNASPLASTQCNVACKGDASTMCGGVWRLNVYGPSNERYDTTTATSATTTSTTSATAASATASSVAFVRKGCYVDSSTRLLPDYVYRSETLTVPICLNQCKTQGYIYAGVESTNECYCSNSFPSNVSPVADSQCNTPCKGDPSTMCGGGWRIDVYGPPSTTTSTTTTTTTSQTSTTATATSTAAATYVSMGCYTDSEVRTLPDFSLNSNSMTPDYCIAQCKPLGYKYLGVENGNECWCSNTAPTVKGTKVADSECSTNCAGDTSKKCGAGWRLNVYGLQTGTPTSTTTTTTTATSTATPSYVPSGCYTDSSDRTLPDFSVTSGTMTPDYCIGQCKPLGYKYLGLENGNECWCSNIAPSVKGTKVLDTECSTNCNGDATKKCGAGWRLSVYTLQSGTPTSTTTTSTPTPSASGYVKLGCFSDQASPRTLPNQAPGSPDLSTQSITACNSKCFAMGKPYAGTQTGTECWCGDSISEYAELTPEADCSSPCSGKSSEKCGGGWRLSIQYNSILDGWTCP